MTAVEELVARYESRIFRLGRMREVPAAQVAHFGLVAITVHPSEPSSPGYPANPQWGAMNVPQTLRHLKLACANPLGCVILPERF